MIVGETLRLFASPFYIDEVSWLQITNDLTLIWGAGWGESELGCITEHNGWEKVLSASLNT